MIIAHTGRPGSGKTYEAVKRMIDELKKGRVVYSNIDGGDDPQCKEALRSLSGLTVYQFHTQFHFLKDDEIENFWEKVPEDSVVIIDEAQDHFNARTFMSKGNQMFNKYSAKHRHYGNDLILITQHISRLDSAVRSLVEWTYDFRKINFFGSLVRKGYQYFAYMGEAYGPYVSLVTARYKPEIYAAYNSYVHKSIKEQGLKSVNINVLKSWRFYMLPICLGLLCYWGYNSSWRYGEFIPGPKKRAAVAAQVRANHIKQGDVEVFDGNGNGRFITRAEYYKNPSVYKLTKGPVPVGVAPNYVGNVTVPVVQDPAVEGADEEAPCKVKAVVDGTEVCYE